MDLDAEREKITKEIQELERILDPNSSSINVAYESSLDSDSDADLPLDEDSDAAGPPVLEEERWDEASNDEDDAKEKALPEDPETCLQLNMVYQEVIQEKLAEVSLLLAQNREQQEEIMWDLAGSKGPKVKEGKSLPPNMYIGHFMKPYFKDRVTGVGPPANEDTREKAAQGIKAFEELLVTKWKNWEKALLRKSVVSDRLQRLLQPKLLKLEYLQQKQSRVTSEAEKQILEKQIRDAEKEVQDINELSEEVLLGSRIDSHDWEKISNVNFEGGRSAKELQKFWQNCEHPSINKEEWSRQEVEQLKAIAAKHGHLEWQKIAEELGTSRSAFQCLQKYQQHNKALKRKEWTEEEDRMLTQLVQEMRVGDHIPYRKIVYYMEGRDSVQLIYRWTKSLDPSLKKGWWAPEEDAKLLKAVAKYGEQDWFKIREEVPGRSDAQCRDRYLRRLHFGLKKGRWNPDEEEKLIELIEKYGVGHWAKIASELPHRTGAQCLSKWKIMVRQKQSQGRRQRRRPLRSVRWSSSSEDSMEESSSSSNNRSSSSSSSSSEDSESEEASEAQEAGQPPPSAQHTIPDMDLWVPARQSVTRLWRREAGERPGCTSSASPRASAPRVQAPHSTHSASPSRVHASPSADTQPASSEKPADELVKVPQKTVVQVLRTNTAAQCRIQKQRLRQPCLPDSAMEAFPAGSCTTRPRGLQQRGHSLQRRLLGRQLLMAVSPWVGDVILPCSQRPAVLHTRADTIRKQLQDARLTSTPVFTLFIQLLQIDTAGCMEVVRERKAPPQTSKVPSSAQDTPGRRFPNVPAQQAAKENTGPKEARGGPQVCQAVPTPHPPRPKTVSELLREKRLREARAKKAAQSTLVLPPSLLVSSPVILQPSHPLAPQTPPVTVFSGSGTPARTSAGPSNPSASAADKRAPALRTLAIAPTPTGTLKAPLSSLRDIAPAASGAPTLGPSWVPVSCHLGLRQSQAPTTCQKQGLPELPLFLPAAPSPPQLPVQPLSLTSVVGTQKGMPPTPASTSLPVTWVLTAQGLLRVPAVLGLPEPAGTSEPPGLLLTLPPSLTKTQVDQGHQVPSLSYPSQAPANTDVEMNLPSRTDHSALPGPPSAQSYAQVDADMASAPKGLSSLGEPQTSAPGTSSQATLLTVHPEAEPPCSNQLPPQGVSDPGTSAVEPRGPLGPEKPSPPQPGPEKGALDLGLLSQESEVAVQEWLRAPRGVCVPPLGTRLPYQAPALCNLRALSGLLRHKKALEHRATSLMPSGTASGLQTVLEQVRRQVQDNPAYLLLKARFLAAFTLPALLATLPPRGVATTLSAAAETDSESDDCEDLEELKLSAGIRHWGPSEIVTDAGETSAPSWDCSDDLGAPRTRLALKRRRLL